MWPVETRGHGPLQDARSPVVGLVRQIHPMTWGAGMPPVRVADIEVAETLPTLQLAVESRAGGAGTTHRGAATSATGEAIERYSAAYVPYSRLDFASRAQLDVYVSPSDQWALFPGRGRSTQGPHPAGHDGLSETALVNLTDEMRVGWVPATRLHDGRASAVPAQWVYLGYMRGDGEPLLQWTTSTGLACAPDPASATLHALLEVVERDAFMRTWRQGRTLPRIRLGGLLRRQRDLAATLAMPDGPRLSVVDLSEIAAAPTMLATLRHPHREMPALALGAASALTRAAAATKAVVEACHTATYAAMLRRAELAAGPGGLDAVATTADGFDRHVLEYVDHDRARAAAFLDAGPEDVDIDWAEPEPVGGSTTHALDIATRWAMDGVETFVVDVTAPDVAELGLSVARVVSPQAVALDVAGAGPYLGQPRLVAGGFETESLNPALHPFP